MDLDLNANLTDNTRKVWRTEVQTFFDNSVAFFAFRAHVPNGHVFSQSRILGNDPEAGEPPARVKEVPLARLT